MNIQPIVEGHGELEAVPVLLRRLLTEAGIYDIGVNSPIRQPKNKLLKPSGLERAIKLSRMKENCRGILILFEDEDGCPAKIGPEINSWVSSYTGDMPYAVALAHREYEAWFLASIKSLRGKRGIRYNAEWPDDPEQKRDAKEAINRLMSRPYRETLDQPALSDCFDLKEAYKRSRSFRHLIKVFGELLINMGAAPAKWPPESWITK